MTQVESLQADFKAVFLDDDLVAEDIVYTPKGGTALNIRGVVHRNPLRQNPERGHPSESGSQSMHDIEIQISRSTVDGVAAVQAHGDTVSVALNYGETPEAFRVAAIINQDPATWRLGLVK